MSITVAISQTMLQFHGRNYVKLADYMGEHGVTFGCGVGGPNSGPVWSGTLIHADGFEGASDLAHEFAHWLIAGPSLRHLPNFGLGTDWRGGRSAQLVPDETRLAIEARAACLGITMLKVLCGDDWRDEVSSAGWKMAESPCWRDAWAHNVEVDALLVDDFTDWMARNG